MTQEVWLWLQGAVNLVLFKTALKEKLFVNAVHIRHCHDDLLLFFCCVMHVVGQLVSYVKDNFTILSPIYNSVIH